MQLTLVSKKTETPEIESFVFKPSVPVIWKAGQFFHYVIHHEPTDDRGSDRWFTIASAPSEKLVMITTRFTDKGSSFKKSLRGFQTGDVIEVSHLEGDFTIEDYSQEYVFIAGGIGITPFRSILKELDHQGIKIAATLLYANRDQNVAYKDELETLAKNNTQLKIKYIFSPEHVDEEKIKATVPNLLQSYFYVSGPKPMVVSMVELLKQMGISAEHIKQDRFPGYPAE